MGLPQNNKQDPEYRRLEQEDRVPRAGEHPAVRTEAEEALFKKALGSMELIYSMGKTPVIVLPMDDVLPAEARYFLRGWCFFEFCLAFSFGNIANTGIHAPVERMHEAAVALKANTVEGFYEGFKATHFTSKGDEAVVLKLFEQTLNESARQ